MEAIKCPNCGNGQCQQIDGEKWECLACDNIFNVHNLSKEFRKTDEHISEVQKDIRNMHQDLKTDLNRVVDMSQNMDRNYLDYDLTISKAEAHMEQGSYDDAYNFYRELSEQYPERSVGWFGKYRALTRDFTDVDNYAFYLCGGIYTDDELGGTTFAGVDDVARAYRCKDADKETIKSKVTDFLERSTYYAIDDISPKIENIRDLKVRFKEVVNTQNTTTLVCRILFVLVFFIALWMIITSNVSLSKYAAANDMDVELSTIFGLLFKIILGFAMLVFNGIFFFKSVTPRAAWNREYEETEKFMKKEVGDTAYDIIKSLVIYDNYQSILGKLSDKDAFFEWYLSDPEDEMLQFETYEDDLRAAKYLLYGWSSHAPYSGKLNMYLVTDDDTNTELIQVSDEFKEFGAKALSFGQGIGQSVGHGVAGAIGSIKSKVTTPTETTCPNCGATIDGDSVFCASCGKKIM